MNELVYRAFGPIPALNPEPSLLHSPEPSILSPLTFYMNDFFDGFKDFKNLFFFFLEHFFPRVEWAKLLLSFKKLRLFATEIKALGVNHRIGGHVYILKERAAEAFIYLLSISLIETCSARSLLQMLIALKETKNDTRYLLSRPFVPTSNEQ